MDHIEKQTQLLYFSSKINKATDYEKVIPSLVITLIERLFDNFLSELWSEKSRQPEGFFHPLNTARWNFKKRYDCFLELTQVDLLEYLKTKGYSDFVSDFSRIKELRNKFVHGKVFHDLNREDAMVSLRLCLRSVQVFIGLNNNFIAVPFKK